MAAVAQADQIVQVVCAAGSLGGDVVGMLELSTTHPASEAISDVQRQTRGVIHQSSSFKGKSLAGALRICSASNVNLS